MPRELVMLITGAGRLEVFDLCLNDALKGPMLLKAMQPAGGSMVAAEFSADAELVMVATADPSGCAGKLYGYNVDTGYCAICLCLHGRPAQLAHCGGDALLACCTTEGLLEVFCTASPGPALARVDTSANTLDTESELTVTNVSLAWCDGKRWLAMAGHPYTVLVYAFHEGRRGGLELSVRLQTETEQTVPCGLAWAPDLGALLAAHSSAWQFWLLDSSVLQEDAEGVVDGSSSSADVLQAEVQQEIFHPHADAEAVAAIERLGVDGLDTAKAEVSELANLLGEESLLWEEEEEAAKAWCGDGQTTSIFQPADTEIVSASQQL